MSELNAQTVERDVLGVSGSTQSTNSGNTIDFTIGQVSDSWLIGNSGHMLSQGYIQPDLFNDITSVTLNSDVSTICEGDSVTFEVFTNSATPLILGLNGNEIGEVDSLFSIALLSSSWISIKTGNALDSIFITVAFGESCPEQIIVYEYVSPNQDGDNDYWEIYTNRSMSEFHVSVYNVWNQLIYQSDNYQNNWEADIPDGNYFYIVREVLSNKEFKGILRVQR